MIAASKLHGWLVMKDAGSAAHSRAAFRHRIISVPNNGILQGAFNRVVIVHSLDKTPCISLASASKIIMGKRTQPFQLGSFQDSTLAERALADVIGRKEAEKLHFPPISRQS